MTTKQELVERILGLTDSIYRTLQVSIPPEWLSSDLTVAQLRVLLLLHTEGALRMSAVAAKLGIAVSTATGIMDKLVAKGFVLRQADEQDRRLVVMRLSPAGTKLMNAVWELGRAQIEKLLQGLDTAELKQAAELVRLLRERLPPGSISS